MTSNNILKIVEFRERYKAMRIETEWQDFKAQYEQLKKEMEACGITDHLVMMEQPIFDEIVEKSGLSPIIADCYHTVEMYLISKSNK